MTDALTGADRRAFWHWLLRAARPYLAWVLVALGALAIFLGWYGVSGESLTAKQLPYLISGGASGLGLIMIAAALLVTDGVRREVGRLSELERKVDDLYALLVLDAETAGPLSADPEPDPAGPGSATEHRPGSVAATGGFLALPTGSTYHRADCALVAGKREAVVVTADDIAARDLHPCSVCEPAPAPAVGPAPAHA